MLGIFTEKQQEVLTEKKFCWIMKYAWRLYPINLINVFYLEE